MTGKTPEQLVEDGVALIAKGLFRANEQNGPTEAADLGSAATSTIRSLWLDFYKQAQRSEVCAK